MTDLTKTPDRSLSHVTEWVFDLDNTLYPRECNLFAQIDILISHYMVSVTNLAFDELGRCKRRITESTAPR